MLDIALPRITSNRIRAKFRQLRYRATGGRVWQDAGQRTASCAALVAAGSRGNRDQDRRRAARVPGYSGRQGRCDRYRAQRQEDSPALASQTSPVRCASR